MSMSQPISRAVRDKYLECRWGIFELKYFFSNKTSDGNNCNVLTCIQEIIRSENKQKPLSDAKIAEQLEKKGDSDIEKNRDKI